MTTTKRTRLGIEVLKEEKLAMLAGQRIGLVCNPASVFPDFRHAADIFFEHPEINLTDFFNGS